MPYGASLVTTATIQEPLTLEEAKAHLNLDADVSEWDTEVLQTIKAAREYVESALSRPLISQTWDLFFDGFPTLATLGNEIPAITERIVAGQLSYGELVLPMPGVSSVTSVKYYDTSGVQQTLDAATYQADLTQSLARLLPVQGQTWPVTYARLAAVTVRVVVGQAVASLKPMLKHAVILVLKALYDGGDPESPAAKRVIEACLDGRRHGPENLTGPYGYVNR